MDPQAACVMDVALCQRHIGAQPGGGICAICLQERLIQLWRGEGNFTWDMEEFSVTPPPCKTPSVGYEPSPVMDGVDAEVATTSGACFPVIFRMRHLQRGVAQDSSKEREKIDRSSDRQQQFSCELRSIVKEIAALHERKRIEKAGKKRVGTTTDRGGVSERRQPEEEVAEDVAQGPIPASSGLPEAAPDPATSAPSLPPIPKSKVSIVEDEEEADEEESRYSKTMCFSAMWPAIANMKWARVLVSPIMSSNKIAPSKSDLLSKLVNGLPKTTAVGVEEARAESGRNCETSGSMRENIDFDLDSVGQTFGMPGPAILPPRYVQPAIDEDGTVIELDKETKQRMEASRITVLTWLQSLPSPKAGHMTTADPNNSNSPHLDQSTISPPTNLGLNPFPDGGEQMSLGNGVLEMCDEEEMEFDCMHSQHTTEVQNSQHTTEVQNSQHTTGVQNSQHTTEVQNSQHTTEVQNSQHTTEVQNSQHTTDVQHQTTAESFVDAEPEILAHVASFGKFLRSPVHGCAPTRTVDIEIPAQ